MNKKRHLTVLCDLSALTTTLVYPIKPLCSNEYRTGRPKKEKKTPKKFNNEKGKIVKKRKCAKKPIAQKCYGRYI